MGLRHDLRTGSLSGVRSCLRTGLFGTDELLLAIALFAMRSRQLSACVTVLERPLLERSLLHNGLLSDLANRLRGRQLTL